MPQLTTDHVFTALLVPPCTVSSSHCLPLSSIYPSPVSSVLTCGSISANRSFIFKRVCLHVHLGAVVHTGGGHSPPGAGVTSGWKPPDTGAGDWTVMCFQPWAISSVWVSQPSIVMNQYVRHRLSVPAPHLCRSEATFPDPVWATPQRPDLRAWVSQIPRHSLVLFPFPSRFPSNSRTWGFPFLCFKLGFILLYFILCLS